MQGIKGGSFLTVIDDDDEEPLVNVVITIEERYVTIASELEEAMLTVPSAFEEQDKPVKADFEAGPDIPRKPRKAATVTNGESNGTHENGNHSAVDAPSKSLKRAHPGDDAQPTKKAKIAGAEDDNVVLVQDDDGTIVISDD